MKFGELLGRKSEKPQGKVDMDGEFNPEEELRNIRRASKEERAEKLDKFKEKLSFHKEGLGQMQERLIQEIRKNPDASFEELYQMALQIGARYGMNEQQRETAKEILQTYTEKHAKIRELRERYPNDKDLYRALFGQNPKGRVEVITGPITFYFRCQNLDDYTRIDSQSFWRGTDITAKDRKEAKVTSGVSIATSLIPGLEGAIIAENSSSMGGIGYAFKSLSGFHSIHPHEEQHAIKRLFSDKVVEHSTLERLESATTDKERERALKSYLRHRRQDYFENRAKGEILAYFKGGNDSAQTIVEILIKPQEKQGLYDFLADDEDYIKNRLAGKLGSQFQNLIDKAVNEVYRVEYKQLLKDATRAIWQLKKTGHSTDKAISILIHEPLSKWKKAVERLIEKKE